MLATCVDLGRPRLRTSCCRPRRRRVACRCASAESEPPGRVAWGTSCHTWHSCRRLRRAGTGDGASPDRRRRRRTGAGASDGTGPRGRVRAGACPRTASRCWALLKTWNRNMRISQEWHSKTSCIGSKKNLWQLSWIMQSVLILCNW